MAVALTSVYGLFFGVALLMIGGGLQGSLLGVRASIENFDTTTLGVVMSGYFVGFLAGSQLAPRFVSRVGHVRVFAALASLASGTVLLHGLFVDPLTWGLMRLLTGFCYAGLYVVAESWLNDMSDNQNRGRLLSLYMIIQLGGLAGGQFLLPVAEPGGMDLFALVAVLVSVAVVPMCLSASKTPDFDEPERLTFRQLYKASPLGSFGIFATGLAQGTFFGFGSVYAQEAGFSLKQISIFMALAIVGGMISQLPLGRLSDRIDRRVVIASAATGSAVSAFVAITLLTPADGAHVPIWPLMVTITIFGAFCMPLYSLCIAHVADHVSARQMVSASAALVFLGGCGAIVGPNVTGVLMTEFGPQGFFVPLTAASALIAAFALFRMTRRAAPTDEQQVDFVTIPPRASPYAAQLAPDAVEEGSAEEEEKEDTDTVDAVQAASL